MVFAINSTSSQEGTGSSNDRFLGRSVRSRMPNSINPEIESSNLIKRRIEKHDNRIKGKNKTNKILYKVGDRIRLQNITTKEFLQTGTIELLRTTDDGRVVSYKIPKVDKNTKAEAIKIHYNVHDETNDTTDLPLAENNAESRENPGSIKKDYNFQDSRC